MKRIFYSVLAVMMLCCAACTRSEEEGVLPEGGKSGQKVFVRIENVQVPKVRMIEDEKNDKTESAVEFQSGYLFFLTPKGQVRTHYSIVSNEEDVDDEGHKLSLKQIQEGHTFTGISGDVSKVYIVGNVTSDELNDEDIHSGDLPFISDIHLKKISLGNQHADNMNHVALAGIEGLTDGGAGMKEATVTLSPLCARLEIGKITTDQTILDYKLDGVYVAGFYEKMPLNQQCVESDWVSPDYATSDVEAELKTFYTRYGWMADCIEFSKVQEQTEDGHNVYSFYPEATQSKKWAYPFFAIEEPAEGVEPYKGHLGVHLLLKLSGMTVKLYDETTNSWEEKKLEGVRYINLNRFVRSHSAHADAVNFYNGHIYKIDEIKFGTTNLSVKIMPTDVSVKVTVSVAPWKIDNIYPAL